jgi:hypothetical protein
MKSDYESLYAQALNRFEVQQIEKRLRPPLPNTQNLSRTNSPEIEIKKKLVFEILKNQETINSYEAASILCITPQSAATVLNFMHDDDLVERTRGGRGIHAKYGSFWVYKIKKYK